MASSWLAIFFFYFSSFLVWWKIESSWLLCSRVDMLPGKALPYTKRKKNSALPGTHFVRGKMKTSASIKSRFTRSAYLWRLQQLNNCCRVSPLWLVCAVVCLLAFFSAHSSPVCSKFFPAIAVLEVHDRFDQQTNLDEREKMRARAHANTHTRSRSIATPIKLLFSQLFRPMSVR